MAKVEDKMREGFEVKFFKRLHSSNRFQPIDKDTSFANLSQVILTLPKAIEDQRQRFREKLYFKKYLSGFCQQKDILKTLFYEENVYNPVAFFFSLFRTFNFMSKASPNIVHFIPIHGNGMNACSTSYF